MTRTETPHADAELIAAVEVARAAARQDGGDEVGAPVEATVEDDGSVTHLFDADKPGYRGWRWAVTVANAGPGTPVRVSEVVLLPGPDALVAPEWVPWQERVRAGDLGVGDLMPTAPEDPRLVQAYVQSDDPQVEETAVELGLGRLRVLSREGRLEAAERWQGGEFGPRSDMARGAPAACGTCGFYLPVAGSLSAAFGVCGNEIAPADGRAVHAEYGCGAHSEAEVEQPSPVIVADLIYDDAVLDMVSVKQPAETPAAEESTVDAPADEDAAEAAVETPVAEQAVVETPAEAPAVQESAVDVPAGEDIAAEQSGADATVETPVAETPAVEESTVDVPAGEDTAAEQSAEVIVETPVVEQPPVEQSVWQMPAGESAPESTVDASAGDVSAVDEPSTAEEGVAETPSVEPSTGEASVETPAAPESTVDAPATAEWPVAKTPEEQPAAEAAVETPVVEPAVAEAPAEETTAQQSTDAPAGEFTESTPEQAEPTSETESAPTQ
ncbi:DUF3027 family protein [Herbihabitans rhizosphaerae]|uniref:DUF3027 family protein n=1 Tax=Herbihabitans rhizosphaerae TaxID=1872711 RepID=A0A4Q7KWN7_9PSEU|nr:DUF3027 domain-containing protein [Herbihabitans rhizosphaerae]RZS41006.1 DUF3027 family protein [Herbihabitans rhizosphaerae]